MAKRVIPLTDTKVKNAKPKDKEYTLSDGDGLELRIRPAGSKRWVLKYYKPFTKKRTNLGLGTYPEISLAQARIERKQYRELLAQNIDPKEHKLEQEQAQKERLASDLIQVAKNWFDIKKTTIQANTASDLWRSLELHIFPSLGKIPVSKLTAPLVIDALKPIAAKGTLETVKRLSQRLNEIMTYAVNTGLVHANPLTGIGSAFKKPVKKNMPAIKPEELPEFLATLQYASIKLVTRSLIEW